MTLWQPISEQPEFDRRPMRQFIRIEGYRSHSGERWARVHFDVAYIRPDGAEDGILGYRDKDIARICRDGDMEIESVEITHWMPAIFPALGDGERSDTAKEG